MANVKATMTDIRVIIREFSRGTSLREMERKLKLSRTSLRNYRDRAEASGRSMADLLALNDAELQAIMLKGDGHRGRDSDRYAFMQERVEGYAKDMTRKHMTYDVLYEEYQKSTDNPYGYTQFKAIIQEYERNHDYRYHNVYEPGREMQFDFAGDNLWIVDKDTGEASQGDCACLCPAVFDAQLCDRTAKRKDGISLPGTVKSRQILRRCSRGLKDRQHAPVDKEDRPL